MIATMFDDDGIYACCLVDFDAHHLFCYYCTLEIVLMILIAAVVVVATSQ